MTFLLENKFGDRAKTQMDNDGIKTIVTPSI